VTQMDSLDMTIRQQVVIHLYSTWAQDPSLLHLQCGSALKTKPRCLLYDSRRHNAAPVSIPFCDECQGSGDMVETSEC
jgi:hypothetical protein